MVSEFSVHGWLAELLWAVVRQRFMVGMCIGAKLPTRKQRERKELRSL
jgi:hypothetical protein